MAQVLVHMDDDLKRRLKARLAQEGRTLRSWAEEAARRYLTAPPKEVLTARPPGHSHPQAGPAPAPATPEASYRRPSSTYSVEED